MKWKGRTALWGKCLNEACGVSFGPFKLVSEVLPKPFRERVILFTEARVERFHGFMAVFLFFFHCDYWHL